MLFVENAKGQPGTAEFEYLPVSYGPIYGSGLQLWSMINRTYIFQPNKKKLSPHLILNTKGPSKCYCRPNSPLGLRLGPPQAYNNQGFKIINTAASPCLSTASSSSSRRQKQTHTCMYIFLYIYIIYMRHKLKLFSVYTYYLH